MNLLNEQLARAQCQEMLVASQRERLVRRAVRQRRAARLVRRAGRLVQGSGTWSEAPAVAA